MSIKRRIDHLQTVWPPLAPPTEREREWEQWLSTPAYAGVLLDFAEDRAHRRYYGERGLTGSTGWRFWYGLTDEERRGLARREVIDLTEHQRRLGAQAGWDAWLADAEAWPQLAWPNDGAAFRRRLAHEREVLDNHRGYCARWRAQYPDWQLGMSEAEHDAFEVKLLTEAEG